MNWNYIYAQLSVMYDKETIIYEFMFNSCANCGRTKDEQWTL